MRTLAQDLRYAFRLLVKNPGFTSIAVLTLALGVGANTAIFSVVKAVLLNQLPYSDPDRLAAVSESDAKGHNPTIDFPTAYDLRSRSHLFDRMSLYRYWSGALVGSGDPERINGLRVNHDWFDLLGVKVQLGRTFRPEEDKAGRTNELILAHGLWLRRFGGDPNIIGRNVRLNEASFVVVGVLPASFQILWMDKTDAPREMFAPLGYELGQRDACRGCQHLHLLGRMKSGVDVRTAGAELNTLMRGIVGEHPNDYETGQGIAVTALQDVIQGPMRTALWVLLGAVGFILLIACANVTNLLLARSMGRAKEIALRKALGAGRDRLVRQLLTESLLLAVAGGVAGVLLAMWGTSLLATVGPKEIPRVQEVKLDLTVLLFGISVSLMAGVAFGLAPAIRASRVDLNDALKDQGKSTESRSRLRLRSVLVASELALAFVLAVGAALLGKSFIRLMNVDAGFDPHNVLTLSTYVYGQVYQKSPEAEIDYYKRAMNRLRATGEVENAAMVSVLPLAGDFDRRGLQIQEHPLANPSDAPSPDHYSITPGYFNVMRIPVKRGRAFTDQDRQGSPLVAIISESCARLAFPNEDPLGKHIQLGGRDDKKPWATIVGIVGDVRQYGLDRAATMAVYMPQAQDTNFTYLMVARTTVDPRRLESAARAAFLEADKTQPLFDIKPLDDYLQDSLSQRSFTLALIGLFGALALALGGIGAYGVISHGVSGRTRELGIRMALGAHRRDVLKMIMKQGAGLAAAGLVLGFAASLLLTRFLTALLFEVRPWDPVTSFVVAVVLAAVALLAAYVPARRATRVDPMVALRYE